MASLKNTLNQVMQQNSSLKSKLQQINLISQVDDLPQIPSIGITDTMIRGFGNPSLSYRYKKICYTKNKYTLHRLTKGYSPRVLFCTFIFDC